MFRFPNFYSTCSRMVCGIDCYRWKIVDDWSGVVKSEQYRGQIVGDWSEIIKRDQCLCTVGDSWSYKINQNQGCNYLSIDSHQAHCIFEINVSGLCLKSHWICTTPLNPPTTPKWIHDLLVQQFRGGFKIGEAIDSYRKASMIFLTNDSLDQCSWVIMLIRYLMWVLHINWSDMQSNNFLKVQ